MNKAPFITLEGGEGAGKTSQIKLLKQWLELQGNTVTTTREPGGTPGAEDIRNLIVQGKANRWDAQTDTLLFMAARRDLLTKIIWPALEKGDWVVSDRFCDSTYAYQCFGRGLKMEAVQSVYQFVAGDFKPDLTFLLDIDPRVGLERVFAGKPDRNTEEHRFESFDFSFHEKLREGYHFLASREPERFVIIDANTDVDTIQEQLRRHVQERFGL